MGGLQSFSRAASLGALSLFALTGTGQSEPAQDRILTPAQIERDVALAQKVYETVHPGYTRYSSAEQLHSAWQSINIAAAAEDGLSLGTFYVEASEVLAEIRCDHTKAELPDTLAEARKTDPVYLPFQWEMIEGRGFVTLTNAASGLQRGDELLAIDGQPLSERIEEILPLIPYDGLTEWTRPAQVAISFEFRGGGLDHFGALMYETLPTAELTIKRGDDDPATVTVERVTYPDWLALGDGKTGARNFKDAVRFERIGDDAAYLAVDTFVNYRVPVNPATIYDPVFQAMKDEGRDTLIVDLRLNGGGSDDASRGLIARLIDTPAPFMRDIRVKTLDLSDVKEHLWTWDQNALAPDPRGFTQNPDGTYSLRPEISPSLQELTPPDLAFRGQLILLTSRNNSSGSTHLLSFIKAQNPDAILIGERTGGSAEGATAGILFTLTLPESGIKMRVPAMQSFVNNNGFEFGYGMSPDTVVPETVQSFLAGNDPALDAALALIESSRERDPVVLK
ncbi:MAG: S41 family peptidase [Pseudomonadota bacterium]